MMSRKRGKSSNRKLPEGIRNQIIGLTGTHYYSDFGPALVCEKLNEHLFAHSPFLGEFHTRIAPRRGQADGLVFEVAFAADFLACSAVPCTL